MPAQYRVGERVRVTVEGVVTEVDGKNGEHIEITYAFTDRLKATLSIFPGATAASVNSLEDGTPVAGDTVPALKLKDRWEDNDGDIWRVARADDGTLGLTLRGPTVDTWGFVLEQYGPLTLVTPADTEQAPVGTPGEGTVPIGGVAPKSIVSCPGWNDGRPVTIVTVEDSERGEGQTFVTWRPADAVWPDTTPAHVASDMQVTPWTPAGGAL